MIWLHIRGICCARNISATQIGTLMYLHEAVLLHPCVNSQILGFPGEEKKAMPCFRGADILSSPVNLQVHC